MRKEGEKYDRTHLSEKVHGRRVHRDYAAHYFRWGFAGQRWTKDKYIIEVGCGAETPLLQVLSGHQSNVPEYYLGVDLNEFVPPHRYWAEWLTGFDFVQRWNEIWEGSLELQETGFDLAICFEVIEHMDVEEGQELLEGLFQMLDPGGHLLLSTPVYDGRRMARNHVHEYMIDELQATSEYVGFQVARRFGTFMDFQQIAKCASSHEQILVERLRDWYSPEVISTFLAPLYPDNSRNNLWVLQRPVNEGPLLEGL